MYTLTQVAAYLGVGITTVSHWISRGKIKAITKEGDNKCKFITKEELEQFKNGNPAYKNIGSPSIVIMKLHCRRDQLLYDLKNSELDKWERYNLEYELHVITKRLRFLNKMM